VPDLFLPGCQREKEKEKKEREREGRRKAKMVNKNTDHSRRDVPRYAILDPSAFLCFLLFITRKKKQKRREEKGRGKK